MAKPNFQFQIVQNQEHGWEIHKVYTMDKSAEGAAVFEYSLKYYISLEPEDRMYHVYDVLWKGDKKEFTPRKKGFLTFNAALRSITHPPSAPTLTKN